MATLVDIIQSDLDDVFFDTDEFAQSVTYNGTSIDALVEYGVDLTQSFNDGWQKSGASLVTIEVKASDVPSPAYQDAVIIGATTYAVSNVKSGDGYTWMLELITDERPRLR